jgi:dipeptide/tripeptide permease
MHRTDRRLPGGRGGMPVSPRSRSARESGAAPAVPLAPVLGLIGTFLLCAAAMMAHLSPGQLKPVAMALWFFGLALQVAAFAMAWSKHSQTRR